MVTHVSPRSSKVKSKSRRASKDTSRRSRTKKHHGASPFADDEEIIEAEKQYFLKLEAVFEQPDSTSHLTFTKLFSETLFRLKESLRNNELFELKLHGPIHPIFKVSYCINMKYR